MRLRNHVNTQTEKRFKRYNDYAISIYDMKFGMLQVRTNEISLRKWSDGTAQLRTLEGTMFGMHLLLDRRRMTYFLETVVGKSEM